MEIVSHERVPHGYPSADRPIVVGYLRYDHRINPAHVTFKPDVLHQRALERRIARALANPQQRAVEGVAPIDPCGNAVGQHFMKIVVAVPRHSFIQKVSPSKTIGIISSGLTLLM